jgi:hypothetical protein
VRRASKQPYARPLRFTRSSWYTTQLVRSLSPSLFNNLQQQCRAPPIQSQNLTTHDVQRFTLTFKELVWAHLILVHVFHAMSRLVIRRWPVHYPGLQHFRYGGIASDLMTIDATKFMGPHIPRLHQYIINAYFSGPNQRGP